MAKFYVSYAWKSNLRNNYSVVEAEDYGAARYKVQDTIGTEYAFIYGEDEYHTAIEKYNLIEVPLQRQVCLR